MLREDCSSKGFNAVAYSAKDGKFIGAILLEEQVEHEEDLVDFSDESIYEIVATHIDSLVEFLNEKKYPIVGGYNCLGTQCFYLKDEAAEDEIKLQFFL